MKSRGMSPPHECVYKRDRNDQTGIRVKSLKGNGQRKINPAAAVSKSARNMVKCDSSKRNSFIYCRCGCDEGVEAQSNRWGRGEVVGVAWCVFWASALEGKRGSGLPMVSGSDFIFDSIAGGDCVLREKMHSSNHIYIPTETSP